MCCRHIRRPAHLPRVSPWGFAAAEGARSSQPVKSPPGGATAASCDERCLQRPTHVTATCVRTAPATMRRCGDSRAQRPSGVE